MSLVLRRSEPLCSLSPSLPEPSPSALSPRTAPSAGPADPRPPGPSRRPGPPQPAAPGPARGARRTPTPGASPSPVVHLELFFHPRRTRQTWAPGSAFPCPPRPPAKAGGASVPHNARWVTDVQRLAGNRRCSTETNQYAARSPGRRRWAERGPAGATPPGRAAPARLVGGGRRTWTVVCVHRSDDDRDDEGWQLALLRARRTWGRGGSQQAAARPHALGTRARFPPTRLPGHGGPEPKDTGEPGGARAGAPRFEGTADFVGTPEA